MRIKKVFSKFSADLLILSSFLLTGILLGALVASNIDNEVLSKITETTSNLVPFSLDRSILETMWNIFKYPLIVFFLAFTSFGTIMIPVTLALKGYFLSFTIGAILKVYGLYGIILNLSIFGIQSFLLVPCLLVMGIHSFYCSKKQSKLLFGSTKTIDEVVFTKRFFSVSILCVLTLILLTLLEVYVTPLLVSGTFKNL